MPVTKRLHCRLLVMVMTLASQCVFAAASGAADDALIQRGKYLATAGDCVACHTVSGGKPFAGGLLLPTPVGSIVATNITPSKTHGIGNYTLEQFTDAMRKGRRADGQYLYPAMPYTSYAKVTDEDIAAMYAYFMKNVAAVDTATPATDLPFPFNIRLSMAAWNFLFLDDTPFQPDPGKNDVWNRGAYLARGLTHCTTCHTPRNTAMAEDLTHELAGGDVGTWYAPNITSDPNSGIGGWSNEEIVEYLRTGRVAGKGQASGPMAEAVDQSLQYLTTADLQALAAYLKTVPAIHNNADIKPVFAWGAPADELSTIRGVALPDKPDQWTGAQLYDAHCATCHQTQGQGTPDGGLPPLFHNTALGRSNPNNLVMVILDGIHREMPDATELLMPGFEKEMSDQQIATLASYLTLHYGNPQAEVTAAQVKMLRAGGEPTSGVVWLARGAMAAVILVLVALIFMNARRRYRRDRRR